MKFLSLLPLLLGSLTGVLACDRSPAPPERPAAPKELPEVAAGPIADTLARFMPQRPAHAVTPTPGLPHEVEVVDTSLVELDGALGPAAARDHVDVVRFGGRVHVAVRSLLGDGRARIDVVSSEDERQFRLETTLSTEGALHSGRFLSWNGTLFAYASELEPDEPLPKRVLGSRLDDNGLWQAWRPLALSGQVVFRAKVEHGVPLMTSWALSEKTYQFEEQGMEVRLSTTEDGFEWRPLDSGRRVVYRGGGSEAAFSSDDDGNLFSVVKNEAGDESGFGSSLCAAKASDWARWDCVNDPKKYDSPTLFNHQGELYLIARRHAESDGRYDQSPGFSLLRKASNAARDLAAPKRCSVWHFSRGPKRVDFVLDLPSKGNTCSAAVLPGPNPGEFVVYDQSSPLEGPDWSLREALARPTRIYRHVLRFSTPSAE